MCIVVRKTSVHSQNVSGYSGYKLHYYMSEILYIEKWADENNLRLNCAKSKELIFTAISSRATSSQLPVECLNIERVTSLRILGVIISNRLTATEHVNNLLSSCSSFLYAMRVLRSHGTPVLALHDVFRATVVAKIIYCAPAWSGMCTAADRSRLTSFINRCKCLGFCDSTQLPLVTELFSEADDLLSQKTLQNTHHVLQRYLPERSELCYNLRNHTHNKLLINKTSHLNDDNYFIIRMLYKNSYWQFLLHWYYITRHSFFYSMSWTVYLYSYLY